MRPETAVAQLTRPRKIQLTIAITIVLATGSASAIEGFYKDVFIDGGFWLTGRQSLAAAEYLGLTQEALALPYEPTDQHEQIQADKIVGPKTTPTARCCTPTARRAFA